VGATIRCLCGFLIGSAFGLVLTFIAAMLSGGGEGFTAAFAIFASPFSAILPVKLNPLAVSMPWIVVGSLLGLGHRRSAQIWLIIHALMIPVAIVRALPRDVSFGSWLETVSPMTIVAWGGVYVAGYIAAWLTTRQHRA
jgi:hypothetical protein